MKEKEWAVEKEAETRKKREQSRETESKQVLHVCWFPALSGPCQAVIYGTETGSSLCCQLSIVTTDS